GETRPFEPRECERGTCRLAGREQRLVAYLQIAAVTGCELCDACPREAVLCPERELAEGKCPLDFDPGILHPTHVLVLVCKHRIVRQLDQLDQVFGGLIVV